MTKYEITLEEYTAIRDACHIIGGVAARLDNIHGIGNIGEHALLAKEKLENVTIKIMERDNCDNRKII